MKHRNKRTSSLSMGSLANVITDRNKIQNKYQSNMLQQQQNVPHSPHSPKRRDYNRSALHSKTMQQQQQQYSSTLLETPNQYSSTPLETPHQYSSTLLETPHQYSKTPPPFAQHRGQKKPLLVKQKTVNTASLQSKPLLEKSLYPVQTNNSFGALSHKGSNSTLNKYKQNHSRVGSSYTLRQYAAHNANGSSANGNTSQTNIVSPLAQPMSHQQTMVIPQHQQSLSMPHQQSLSMPHQQSLSMPQHQSLNTPPPRLHPFTAGGSVSKPVQFSNSPVPQYRGNNSYTPTQQSMQKTVPAGVHRPVNNYMQAAPQAYVASPGNKATYWNAPPQNIEQFTGNHQVNGNVPVGRPRMLVYTGESNKIRKPGLSKRQLLKMQMRTAFQFPNGEKFTPRTVQNVVDLEEKEQPQQQDGDLHNGVSDASHANNGISSNAHFNAPASAVPQPKNNKAEDSQSHPDMKKSSSERTSFASSNRTITGPKLEPDTKNDEVLNTTPGTATSKSKPVPVSPVKKQSKFSKFFKNIFSSGSSSKPLPKPEPSLQEKRSKSTKDLTPIEIKPQSNTNMETNDDSKTNKPIINLSTQNPLPATPTNPLTDMTLESPPVSPLIDIDIDMLFDSLMISSSSPEPFSTTPASASNGSPEKPPLFSHSQNDMGSRTSSITSKSNMARLKLLQQANMSNSSLTSSKKTSSPLKSPRGIDEMMQGSGSDLTENHDNTSEGASSIHSMSDGLHGNEAYEYEDYPVFIERLGQHFSSIKTLNDDGSCKVYDSHGFIVKQDSIVSLPTTKSSNSTYKSNLHRKDGSPKILKHKGCMHSANHSGSTNNSSLSSASSSSRANSMSTKSTSPMANSNSSQTQQQMLKFNNTVEVFPVYNSEEYERNFDLSFKNATRDHLMKNIGAIKVELNQYKKFQMLVHHDSVENTHLFG